MLKYNKVCISGMIGVTLFGIFLTPVFYSTVRMLFGRRKRSA